MMMRFGNTVFLFAALIAAGGVSAAERIGDWNCTLPTDVYKAMAISERTCADRAAQLINTAERQNGQQRMNTYRTAANEWKRFNNEFMTSSKEEALAWASFFEAYCLSKAADRNKGIELFNETIELYPDSPAAAASMYFRACTYRDNGILAKALDSWRELCDSENFSKHPLALSAHMNLAGKALEAGKLDDAVREWDTVRSYDRKVSPREWDDAGSNLLLAKAFADPARAWDESFTDADDIKNPGRRLQDVRWWRAHIWGNAMGNPNWHRSYFEKNKGAAKDGSAAAREYLKKFTQTFEKKSVPYYKKADAQWEYALTCYDMWNQLDGKTATEKITKLAGAVRKDKDQKRRASRGRDLINRLKNSRKFTEARTLLDLFTDKVQRGYIELELCETEQKWKDAIAILDEVLEKVPDPNEADGNRRRHAGICQRIGEYDNAIKLYEQAPNPPSTLWSIAECHRSAGRKPKAQAVLDEICSIFPNDAPNAMLRKGDWYSSDGDKKQAIGCYRRILGHVEWKKSGAASQAHQRLEGLGIATGGAVLNEVH